MKNLSFALGFAMILAAFPVCSHAATETWQYSKNERLEQTVEAAWVENQEGYRFSLVREDDGRVTAIFQIPEDSTMILGTEPPLYRVDDREERSIASWGIYVEMETKQVSWFIWDGTGDPCDPDLPAVRRKKALCEIMQGQKMVFEFYRITGEAERTRFSLKGSREAVRALLKE